MAEVEGSDGDILDGAKGSVTTPVIRRTKREKLWNYINRAEELVGRPFNYFFNNTARTRTGAAISAVEFFTVVGANIAAEYPQVHGPYRTALDVVAAVSTTDFIISGLTGHGLESVLGYIGRQAGNFGDWADMKMDAFDEWYYREGKFKNKK